MTERVEATAEDRRHMRRALQLAERGWGRVHPNPLVGAVVVRGGEVIGEGWHAEYGGPHAEVAALEAAGERARGATLYVTLEPCVHEGKTPPCTDAILRAGLARVVIGARDPHPEAGGGAERLRRAGMEVLADVEAEAVRAQNAPFFHALERGSPYVAIKYALSLDARLAASPGEPTGVTGAAARQEAQRLRAGYDAILVGIGTVLSDDPRLTVRGEIRPRVPPARVVLDSGARLPLESRLAASTDAAPVLVFCGPDAPQDRRDALLGRGIEVAEVPLGPSRLALGTVLETLWARGIRSVFCEGGGRVGAALLTADAVERLHLFYAPRLFGAGGVPAFPGSFPETMSGGWVTRRLERFGQDVLLELDRRR